MQRKVFRIERMVGGNPAARDAGAQVPDKIADPKTAPARFGRPDAANDTAQSLECELAELNDAVAHTMRELAALIGDSHERHMARAHGLWADVAASDGHAASAID